MIHANLHTNLMYTQRRNYTKTQVSRQRCVTERDGERMEWHEQNKNESNKVKQTGNKNSSNHT